MDIPQFTQRFSHYGRALLDKTCIDNFLNYNHTQKVDVVARTVAVAAIVFAGCWFIPTFLIAGTAAIAAFTYMTAPEYKPEENEAPKPDPSTDEKPTPAPSPEDGID